MGTGEPTFPCHRLFLLAQAKQSLEAQLADELALRQGQVVKITHIIDKDWFRSWTNINI